MTPPLPSHAISPAKTRILLALIRVYDAEGRATFRDVAEAADRTMSATYRALRYLRAQGLATWEDGRAGTLRPLVTIPPTLEALNR